MNIIQIRGTSGSGKSTVMRNIMGFLPPVLAHHRLPRKNPLYYYTHAGVVILGHYDANCGGCDTIGSSPEIYKTIQYVIEKNPYGNTILCEGLLLSEDTKWTLQLREDGHRVRILFLTTPVDECVSRVIKRRAGVGNTKPFKTENTTNRYSVIERAYEKLKSFNFEVAKCPSSTAHKIILNWMDTNSLQS